MRPLACLACVIALPCAAAQASGPAAAPYKKAAGPCEVDTLLIDWKDGKRDRDVPLKLYFPSSGAGPFPLVLFSHGLGGSRQGYEYLGRHWASHGYVCVHLQHKGSDEEVWKGKKNALEEVRKAVRTPGNALSRAGDVAFAIDQLGGLNREGKLKGRLDLQKLGLAGHSFGAQTTLTAAGQAFIGPLGGSLRRPEPRLKAAVAMSPAPQAGKIDRKKAYAGVKVPVFHLTGTRDGGMVITETKPADRRVPYDHIASGPQYLLVLEGGDHMVFAGVVRGLRGRERDPRFRDLIRMSTTAFWDAHLKGDPGAREWLTAEFKKVLGGDGTFELKK